MTTTPDSSKAAVDDGTFRRLRRDNIVLGAFHAIQAVIILAIANDFALPVTATFLNDAPGAAAPEVTELFDIRIAWGVATFLFMSAAAHWIIASPGVFPWYKANLLHNRNYARWMEYSLSSSVMIVLIAMLPGISDIAALLALFGVNAAMILFGWLFEKYEEPGNPNWLSYWFGCLAGVVPWVAIGIYIVSPGAGSPPAFVYAIFISLFIFFNSFAINMALQYKRVGPWSNYLYGERAYMLLSLVAKSLLAWQVFAGTLAA